MPADKRNTSELLAAYVDGVGELTVEERRRVERSIMSNPEMRVEQEATRGMIDKLRELPQEPASEPDWGAMESAIADAVGDEVPRRSWFYRWRFALPAFALAAIAILVLVLRDRTADEAMPIVFVPTNMTPLPAPEVTPDDRVAVYLDGTDLELALETATAADDDLDELVFLGHDSGALEDEASLGFLESTDLAWIDELDDDALARAEQLLDRPFHLRKGS